MVLSSGPVRVTYATVHNRDLRGDFLSLALVHCLLTPFWIY
jgi:hypothetical protein